MIEIVISKKQLMDLGYTHDQLDDEVKLHYEHSDAAIEIRANHFVKWCEENNKKPYKAADLDEYLKEVKR